GRHRGPAERKSEDDSDEADDLERDGDRGPDPAGSCGARGSAKKGHAIISGDRSNRPGRAVIPVVTGRVAPAGPARTPGSGRTPRRTPATPSAPCRARPSAGHGWRPSGRPPPAAAPSPRGIR